VLLARAAATVMKGASRLRVAAAVIITKRHANERAVRKCGGGCCSRSAGITRP